MNSDARDAALRWIVERLEREDGERLTETTVKAIDAALEAHPEDIESVASGAQRAGEEWPQWLQDVLDARSTPRRRGRLWRKIIAEIRAKIFN